MRLSDFFEKSIIADEGNAKMLFETTLADLGYFAFAYSRVLSDAILPQYIKCPRDWQEEYFGEKYARIDFRIDRFYLDKDC